MASMSLALLSRNDRRGYSAIFKRCASGAARRRMEVPIQDTTAPECPVGLGAGHVDSRNVWRLGACLGGIVDVNDQLFLAIRVGRTYQWSGEDRSRPGFPLSSGSKGLSPGVVLGDGVGVCYLGRYRRRRTRSDGFGWLGGLANVQSGRSDAYVEMCRVTPGEAGGPKTNEGGERRRVGRMNRRSYSLLCRYVVCDSLK